MMLVVRFFFMHQLFSWNPTADAYSEAQNASIKMWVPAPQHRGLCSAARQGVADHSRVLPNSVRAIYSVVLAKWFAVLPQTTDWLPFPCLSAFEWQPATLLPYLPVTNVRVWEAVCVHLWCEMGVVLMAATFGKGKRNTYPEATTSWVDVDRHPFLPPPC